MARPRSDIKVTASDALEFEPVEPAAVRPRRRGWKLVVGLVAVAAVAAAGWVAYGERLLAMLGGGNGEVPLVRAEAGPIKVRPENPGGLQVPNRDKLVYDRLQGAGADQPAPVERLLPRPEAPLPLPPDRSRAASGAVPGAAGTSLPLPPPETARVPSLSDVNTVKPPAPAPPAPAVTRSRAPIKLTNRATPLQLNKSALPDAAPPSAQPAEKVTAAPPREPAPRAVAAPGTSRSTTPNTASTETASAPPTPKRAPIADAKAYRVQLAAARSQEAVRAEWDRVRAKNLDLLGDLGLTVTRVDLGPRKGVFYRLRVGPLASDAEARKLCKDLSQRRIGCLVIKPGA